MISWLRLTTVAALLLATWGSDAFAAFFDPLFRITKITGQVLVLKPDAAEAVPAKEGQAYPYGSRVMVAPANPKKAEALAPEAHLVLSDDHQFKLGPGGDIVINHGEGGDETKKVIEIANGKLRTFITISKVLTGGKTDAEVLAGINALTVKTPMDVLCSKLTERNEISVSHDGKYYKTTFLSEGSLMELTGPQFKVRSIKRNSVVEVFGDRDFTRISNRGGEFTVDVERGVGTIESVLFKIRSVVKIWRSYAEIGGKMAVSVMIIASDGSINSYAFLEGQAAVVDSAAAATTAETPLAVADQGKGAVDDTAGEDAEPAFGDAAPAADATAPIDSGAEDGETFDFNFDNW